MEKDIFSFLGGILFFLLKIGNIIPTIKRRKSIYLVQTFVCLFQRHLVEFIVESGEAHQNLRKAVVSGKISEIKQKKIALLNTMQLPTVNLTKTALQTLRNIHKAQGNKSIRACVKLLNSKREIEEPFAQNDTSQSPNFPIVENSAFHSIVVRSKKYFIQNNIPKAAQKKDGEGKPIYRNNRIIQEKLATYKLSWKWSGFLFKKPFLSHTDKAWMECWKGGGGEEFENSCYKSCLVVPITLSGHRLSMGTVQTLGFAGKKDNDDILQSSTVGFVCLDSIQSGVFNEHDSKIAYIFADLISMFFYITRNLTETSTTYKKAEKMLKEAELKKSTNVKQT